MDFAVVTVTGPSDAVRELADELRQVSGDFAKATVIVPGELLIGLRCLPEALGRRSFSRFDLASHTLSIDVTVSEERFGGERWPGSARNSAVSCGSGSFMSSRPRRRRGRPRSATPYITPHKRC